MKKYLVAFLLAGTVMSVQAMDNTVVGTRKALAAVAAKPSRDVRGEFDGLREQIAVYSNELKRMMAQENEQAEPRRAEPNAQNFDFSRRTEMRCDLNSLIRSMQKVQGLLMQRDSKSFIERLARISQENAENTAQSALEFNVRTLEYIETLGEAWINFSSQKRIVQEVSSVDELLALPMEGRASSLSSMETRLSNLLSSKKTVDSEQEVYQEACSLLNQLRAIYDRLSAQDVSNFTLMPEYVGLTQNIESIFDGEIAPIAERMEISFFPGRAEERRQALDQQVKKAPPPAVREPLKKSNVDEQDAGLFQ